MDVRSSTPEGAHFDEIHTSANFDANSNKDGMERLYKLEEGMTRLCGIRDKPGRVKFRIFSNLLVDIIWSS